MNRILAIVITFFVLTTAVFATDRSEEIRAEMWGTADKNFQVTAIPEKWANESAVIIAQLNRFEYRKALMAHLLRYNEYNHYRIKLIDKDAVNKYSEMTYYTTLEASRVESSKMYVGYKVIKPNGKEMIVDLGGAVKMEKEIGGKKQSYYKLAIPNLEPGDILDYYVCEETTETLYSTIYFFQPVIYRLPREFPIMKHKLQFRAERKCYINLKSLNGAPELKLETDATNDERYYTLEGTNIEGLKEQRWLFPYREVPTIKFRAAYASNAAASTYDVLIGEPGIAKTQVSKQELVEMARTLLKGYALKTSSLNKFVKTKLKGVTDPFEIATQSYYNYRSSFYTSSEMALFEGEKLPSISQLTFVKEFTAFLKSKKIAHDIVMTVPRNISAIDNVLMENEIDWLIRVKKGNQFLYLSPFDIYTTPGLDALAEGTQAYALDGMLSPARWAAQKIDLPVSTSKDNLTDASIAVTLDNMTKAKISLKKMLSGRNKIDDQYTLLDVYDYEKDEKSRFTIEEMNGKRYQALKSAYMAKRAEYKTETLKEILKDNFDFKATDPANLVIEQTGRFISSPAMVYSFTFESDELVKKTGPNYIIDAGKLIESQTKIEGDELARKTNIYFTNPRTFAYKIEIKIPDGYEVQGLDNFNQKVENKFGGFTSSAKVENGKVLIQTNKHYDVNYVPKENWSDIVSFLNAAYNFTEQKVLLRKK